MNFFQDVMSDPNLNWGCNPITIRTKSKQFQDGYTLDDTVVEEEWSDVSSPQLLDPMESIKKGYGDYADGEIYQCFLLSPINLNSDPMNYRTIIFNGFEYEVLKCSPFGVRMNTDEADGYWELLFGRRSTKQGGQF